MSWYKSLSYFPKDNLFTAYGCCDFSSIYEGVGSDAGWIRFTANYASKPIHYMAPNNLSSLFPKFAVQADNFTNAPISGTYSVVLGSVDVFWGMSYLGSTEYTMIPRIEVNGASITLYANEVDQWRGDFPEPGKASVLSYCGARGAAFVEEYGWSTVQVSCIWNLSEFYSSTSEYGIYTKNTFDMKCFGNPMWTYTKGEMSYMCVKAIPTTVVNSISGDTVATLFSEGKEFKWVIMDEGTFNWWETETDLLHETVGEETVFKYVISPNSPQDTSEKKPDIVFKFGGYVGHQMPISLLLSEVSLWR